ncbi:unnamed protein product [Brassicogethes aeneus]|uniref:Sulfotransferase domain-containing protein n=1 Tax=Brassicogethes aeneus TaxID=1431903 RepID=A0A9P0B3V9_BRAAE|nr:unnamed protein product [Brassicogethes aeneus]
MSLVVKPFEGEYGKKFDDLVGVKNALYEFPGKCLLPPFFASDAKRIIDAPVRDDDVWLISFPRTGSTWCQEMIWLISNNLDFETAQNTPQQFRAPLIEMSTVLFEFAESIKDLLSTSNAIDFVENMPSPRFIKSHLPLQLLPYQLDKVKPKVIYTLRNPKDMCVSYYHHCQMFHNLSMPFEVFADFFLNDALPMGSVWNHYLSFWNKRHETNVLVLKYEEMKKNIRGTLRKIADHLEKPLSDSDMDRLCEFLTVNKMRENKGCNLQDFIDKKNGENYYKRTGEHFIRKGIVGDWKNYMSHELSERFDKWIEENTRGTDLTFEEI